MKKLTHLGKILSRSEQKRIIGGDYGDEGGGGSGCPTRPSQNTACKCITPDPDGWCSSFGSAGGVCTCLSNGAPACYDLNLGCKN